MDFLGFDFSPTGVLAVVAGAWAAGLALGGVAALLASLVGRRR